MSWYYAENGSQKGPLSDADWLTLVSTGQIKPETLVWQEGMANWLPYAQVSSSATPLAPAAAGFVTCAYCKTPLPADEVVTINGQTVCANCKPVALQMMKEGVTAAGAMNYAGFWIRFGAKLIDGIIGYILGAVIGFVIGLTGRVAGQEAAAIIAGSVSFLVQVAYVIYFNGKYGATLGKMACGLKIVRPDGSSLTYGRAAGRYFAEILSSLTLGIGYIMAGFDDEKRALHDRVADTRVVRK